MVPPSPAQSSSVYLLNGRRSVFFSAPSLCCPCSVLAYLCQVLPQYVTLLSPSSPPVGHVSFLPVSVSLPLFFTRETSNPKVFVDKWLSILDTGTFAVLKPDVASGDRMDE